MGMSMRQREKKFLQVRSDVIAQMEAVDSFGLIEGFVDELVDKGIQKKRPKPLRTFVKKGMGKYG